MRKNKPGKSPSHWNGGGQPIDQWNPNESFYYCIAPFPAMKGGAS